MADKIMNLREVTEGSTGDKHNFHDDVTSGKKVKFPNSTAPRESDYPTREEYLKALAKYRGE
jgi:hypothetical protein